MEVNNFRLTQKPNKLEKMGEKLNVPETFAVFKLIARDEEEENDPNRPHNIAEAIAVFFSAGHQASAEKCHECVTRMLSLLQRGPDGKSKFSIGEAVLCWNCGHTGIPANASTLTSSVDHKHGVCKKCGDNEQTNFVRGFQPGGSQIPWIEIDDIAGEMPV